MANMGRYCKAYPIERLRAFGGWTENAQNTRKERQQVDGKELEVARRLTDDDFLYVQENFVVTDGIFIDENIIYDNVSPDWVDYCKNELKYEVPVYETIETKANGEATA